MKSYCGLNTFKARLGITGASDDAQLHALLRAASQAVDNYCDRDFQARTETRYFDGMGDQLPIEDLLSVTTFKLDLNNDGVYEITMAATDYVLYPYSGRKIFPKTEARIASQGNYRRFADGVTKGVEIAGLWGYGTGITATPYATSGGTTNEGLDATETGVDVSSGALFEVGQTVLVESEQMYITAISANTLTVRRGENGTTAATHDTAKTIYIYEYPEEVREAVFIQAGKLWKRRETTFSQVTAIPELGGFEVNRGLDADVKFLLSDIKKWVSA